MLVEAKNMNTVYKDVFGQKLARWIFYKKENENQTKIFTLRF